MKVSVCYEPFLEDCLEELMMKHFERNLTSTFVVLAVLLFFPGFNAARADLIDLNDFWFVTGDPVTVSSDGTTATITEDPLFSPILLSNDPDAGDPEVIFAEIGGVGQILSFILFLTSRHQIMMNLEHSLLTLTQG